MDTYEYLDFEVEIGPPDPGGIAPVSLDRAPGGEATGFLDINALSELARSDFAPTTLQDARSVGAELFEALFRDQILSRYDVSLQIATLQQKGLRIRLRLNASEAQRLPWELLFDARSDDFLALSTNTPIVRYLPVGAPVESLDVEPPLRILTLIASPADLPPVDRAAEQQNLEQALAAWQRKGTVEVVTLEAQDLASLHNALQRGPWHIFQYVGHARLNPESGQGELLLSNASGTSQPVSAQDLANLLADHKSLRLCMLSACEGAKGVESHPFSSLAAALVREGVPAVLAMREEISVLAAREFTRAFFGAITANLPVDAAVAAARTSMRIADPNALEWATPVLFLRSPDAVLWRAKPLPFPWKRYAIAAAASIVAAVSIWVLMTEWYLPTFHPSQMEGAFKVAVADFGILDADGGMVHFDLGDDISTAIYTNLLKHYSQVSDGSHLVAGITVWHDSAGRQQKNLRFGMVEGAAANERADNARKLAARVNADLVLYGYFDGKNGADKSGELTLEYYYAAPEIAGEPSPTAGNFRFGEALRPAIPYSVNPQPASNDLRSKAARRAEALFWITQGMTKQILNEPEEALAILTEAESRLTGLKNAEGRDLLYLNQAQAAQTARLFAEGLEAVDKALAINPEYVNAMILKGDMLLDRSQLYYVNLRKESMTTEQLLCTTPRDLAGSSSSQEEARSDAESAVIWLEQAVDLAPTSSWPGVEAFARQDLGFAYRHLGQIEMNERRYELSEWSLDASVTELKQSLEVFAQENRTQYYGWGLSGLGISYWLYGVLRYSESVLAYNEGDYSTSEERQNEAFAFMEQSIDSFEQCIDLEPATQGNPVFVNRVLQCSCRPNLEQVKASLQEWQIETGIQVGLAQ